MFFIRTRKWGRKYFEDIGVVKEKNDHLQKTIKLMNEETLIKTVFQYSEQFEVLRAEKTMLICKWKNEQQNRGRRKQKLNHTGLDWLLLHSMVRHQKEI